MDRFNIRYQMTAKCTICNSPDRESIDHLIVSGVSNRSILAQYPSFSLGAIQRHKKHIPAALTQAKKVETVTQADDLLGQVRALLTQAKEITNEARTTGDLKTALLGIGKVKDLLELLLKVTGELESTNTVNIFINPQFQQVQTILLRELEQHPDIRERVTMALQEISK